MKLRFTAAEIVSVVVLVFIGILFLISSGIDYHEQKSQDSAIKLVYSIMESGKLAHMNMANQETITFTEDSYFDGNISNRGSFLLTLDKYQNTSMMMWVDDKYCITKTDDATELTLQDSKKTEQECLTKESTVSDLLTNYNLVVDTEKTGLDTANAFASKKYYAGENPDNYIIFSGSCFRIVHFTEANYMKVVYEGESVNNTCSSSNTGGYINEFVFDEANTNNWDNPATLRNVMEIWTKDNNINNVVKKIDTSKLVDANWYIGTLPEDTILSIKEVVNAERVTTSNKRLWIGLLNVSDYLKASNNMECLSLNDSKTETCKINNYLYKTNSPWFINGSSTKKTNVLVIDKSGEIVSENSSKEHVVRPVLYLNSDIVVTGSGRASSPYIIK